MLSNHLSVRYKLFCSKTNLRVEEQFWIGTHASQPSHTIGHRICSSLLTVTEILGHEDKLLEPSAMPSQEHWPESGLTLICNKKLVKGKSLT